MGMVINVALVEGRLVAAVLRSSGSLSDSCARPAMTAMRSSSSARVIRPRTRSLVSKLSSRSRSLTRTPVGRPLRWLLMLGALSVLKGVVGLVAD